jgi:hypothetical protein
VIIPVKFYVHSEGGKERKCSQFLLLAWKYQVCDQRKLKALTFNKQFFKTLSANYISKYPVFMLQRFWHLSLTFRMSQDVAVN